MKNTSATLSPLSKDQEKMSKKCLPSEHKNGIQVMQIYNLAPKTQPPTLDNSFSVFVKRKKLFKPSSLGINYIIDKEPQKYHSNDGL